MEQRRRTSAIARSCREPSSGTQAVHQPSIGVAIGLSLCVVIGQGLAQASPTGSAAARCERLAGPIDYPRQLLLPNEPVSAVTANDRGEIAVVISEYRPPPLTRRSEVALLRRDATGRLAIVNRFDFARLEPNREAAAVIPGDFDGDGITDLVVRAFTGIGWQSLEFLRGAADGSLSLQATHEIGRRWIYDDWFVSGDFDADTTPEIVKVSGFVTNGELQRLSIVDGQWVAAEPAMTLRIGQAPAVVDWNEDGIDDLALVIDGAPGVVIVQSGDRERPLEVGEWVTFFHPVMAVQARGRRLNVVDGQGFFFFRVIDAVEEWRANPAGYGMEQQWRISFDQRDGFVLEPLDVDGDGEEDLILSRAFHPFYYGPAGFEVRWADGRGEPQLGFESGGILEPIAALDVDGDGTRDLVLGDFSWVRQAGGRVLADGVHATRFAIDYFDEPYAYTVAGDLNEDGLDDLAVLSAYPDTFHLAFARGDGGFRLEPIARDPWEFLTPKILDLDGDGHLDLLPLGERRDVAWGVGDGTFEWARGARRDQHGGRFPARLIATRGVDLIELSWQGAYARTAVATVVHRSERAFIDGPDAALGYVYTTTVGDLDGDGRDDLIYARSDDERGSAPLAVQVRLTQSDGTLGPEEEWFRFTDGRRIRRLQASDVDLDGVSEVLIRRWDTLSLASPGDYTTLRVANLGRFEEAWSGKAARAALGSIVPEGWVDVDGDGRLDLVTGQDAPFFGPAYALRVRRGDGFGGFLPEEPIAWSGLLGPAGRFRTEGGRDLARLRVRAWDTMQIETLPSTSPVLARDQVPPTAELRLTALLDRDQTPARFTGRWRVAVSPFDDCDSTPRVVTRSVRLLPLENSAPVSFRSSAAQEIRVYEHTAQPGRPTQREVLLLGSDAAAMRSLLATARLAAGFEFPQHAPLELGSTAAWGAGSGPTDPLGRLVQRFRFEAGRLVGAWQFHPTEELAFSITSVDRAGRIGNTQIGFRAAREQALRLLCAELPEPFLCPP